MTLNVQQIYDYATLATLAYVDLSAEPSWKPEDIVRVANDTKPPGRWLGPTPIEAIENRGKLKVCCFGSLNCLLKGYRNLVEKPKSNGLDLHHGRDILIVEYCFFLIQ